MNVITQPRLQFLILAAGFSSRLGRPKPLARVRALSLLRRTLTVAARLAPAKIVVVIPRHAARERPVELGAPRHRSGAVLPCASPAAGRSGRSAATRPGPADLALARGSALRDRETDR